MTSNGFAPLAVAAVGICLLASCAQRPDPQGGRAQPYELALPGPTQIARVEDGRYELKNRWVRAVIDGQTGNVAYWGPADGNGNLLGASGITAQISGLAAPAPSGYVEMRDEEAWQFIGDDANQVRWRRIYHLEGDSLFVTYLIQNLRPQPLVGSIEVLADLTAAARVARHEADLLEGEWGPYAITMRAFNERHEPEAIAGSQPALRSDRYTLKPNERISFTMQWRLARQGDAPAQ